MLPLLQTKNILVKLDGSCCLADLGLAVMEQENGEDFYVDHYQVKT